MRTVTLAQASRTLAQYAAELDGDIVVVTERNRPVAALVSLRNVDRESLALSSHPDFIKLMAKARRETAAGRTLSLQDIRERVLPSRSRNRRARPAVRKRRGA